MITPAFIFLAIGRIICFIISIVTAYVYDKRKKVVMNFINSRIVSSNQSIEEMIVAKDEAKYLQKLKEENSIPIDIDVTPRPKRKVEITLRAKIGMTGVVETSFEKKQALTNDFKAILRTNDILVSVIMAAMIIGMVLILLTGTSLTRSLLITEIIGIVIAAIIGMLPSLLWVIFRKR